MMKKRIEIVMKKPITFPNLILEKLRGYLKFNDFIEFSSTCQRYRKFYTSNLNKYDGSNLYWFRRYADKYNKEYVVNRHHCAGISHNCIVFPDRRESRIRSNYPNWVLNSLLQSFTYTARDNPHRMYSDTDLSNIMANCYYYTRTKDRFLDYIYNICPVSNHYNNVEYNYELYDENCNYFYKYVNGKLEASERKTLNMKIAEYEMRLTNHKNRIAEKHLMIDKCKEMIATLESRIEPTTKTIANYKSKLRIINNLQPSDIITIKSIYKNHRNLTNEEAVKKNDDEDIDDGDLDDKDEDLDDKDEDLDNKDEDIDDKDDDIDDKDDDIDDKDEDKDEMDG